MNDEIIEKYMKAGAIAAEARDKGVAQIKPGVSFLNIVSIVEEIIEKRGAAPSFPVNISVNEIAAHFSPLKDDTHVFKTGDVVKLDVGTHIDGYIADTAVTTEVDSDEYTSLISASEEALEKVISYMKPGVSLNEIGKMVQQTIQSYDFQPIENLTGH
ncbi:MAG: M24 family metallopeptidase, partial [Thermoplasmatota archaeon]